MYYWNCRWNQQCFWMTFASMTIIMVKFQNLHFNFAQTISPLICSRSSTLTTNEFALVTQVLSMNINIKFSIKHFKDNFSDMHVAQSVRCKCASHLKQWIEKPEKFSLVAINRTIDFLRNFNDTIKLKSDKAVRCYTHISGFELQLSADVFKIDFTCMIKNRKSCTWLIKTLTAMV